MLARLVAAALFSANPAFAHVVQLANGGSVDYSTVTEKMAPNGRLCCGEKDCEPLRHSDVQYGIGGSIKIYSQRQRAWISIDPNKVGWMDLPTPGVRDDDDVPAGHWCGIRSPHDPEPLQPDPSYTTYCIFLRPPGM